MWGTPNKRPSRAVTIAQLNCSVLTVLTPLILLTIRAGVLWDTKNYGFLQAGDKLRVPVNILVTLLSPRSTLHSLNISRNSLFEEEVPVCFRVFFLFFFYGTANQRQIEKKIFIARKKILLESLSVAV